MLRHWRPAEDAPPLGGLVLATLGVVMAFSLAPGRAAEKGRQGEKTAASAEAKGAEANERAAWEAFVKSLNTGDLAKDYPGPLRDLDSRDGRKTATALDVFGASGRIEAVPYLVALLDSPDSKVRIHAGLNLERIVTGVELQRRDMAHPESVVLRPRGPDDPDLTPLRFVVRRMLTSEDDGNTPAYAATMAGYLGLADLEKELRALLNSRHPAVTRIAVCALRMLDLSVDHEPHPLDDAAVKRNAQDVPGAHEHPDLKRFGFEFVQATAATEQQLREAIARMKLQSRKEGKCATIEDARALLWRSVNIAAGGTRACTEYNGFFLFSRLDWAKPDDRTFKSGFAVKKGTAEIYRWEDK